jgi:hypothetical protein
MIGVGVIATEFPVELVNAVVAAVGVQEQRCRKLPSWIVVYFVMAMALFARSGYAEVWHKLLTGLQWNAFSEPEAALAERPSTAALTKARARLGWEVMAELLRLACSDDPAGAGGGPGHTSRGSRTLYVDAATLDVPDTPSNASEFGLPGPGDGPAGLPQLRVAGIADGGTYRLHGAKIGSLFESEPAMVRPLLDVAGRGDLVVAGPGQLMLEDFGQLLAAGAQVVSPLPAGARLPAARRLPDGSYLSFAPRPAGPALAAPGAGAPGIPVRVIACRSRGERPGEDTGSSDPAVSLVTTLTDPEAAPAGTVRNAYGKRWRVTAALADFVGQLNGGREAVLRSKSPEGVWQEAYGLLCAYQAIRTVIRRIQDMPRLDRGRLAATRPRRPAACRCADVVPLHPTMALYGLAWDALRSRSCGPLKGRRPGPSAHVASSAAESFCTVSLFLPAGSTSS